MHANIKHIIKIDIVTSIFFVGFETKEKSPSKILSWLSIKSLTSLGFIYSAYPKHLGPHSLLSILSTFALSTALLIYLCSLCFF